MFCDNFYFTIHGYTAAHTIFISLHKAFPFLSKENRDPVIYISAKQGDGIPQLEEQLCRAADIPEINENDVIITNARHYEALTCAHEALTHIVNGLHREVSGDLLSEDLRQALTHLADITGSAITTDEVLENISEDRMVYPE